MAMLNINLLAQQQTQVSRFRQAKYAVAAVTGAIVALQLLTVVFLYSTLALRNNEKNSIVEETASLKDEVTRLDGNKSDLYPNMTLTQRAKAFEAQVLSSRKLIDNHKYFSLYLSEIATNTPTTVKFTSFATDQSNNLVMQGQARTYTDVSKLAESFKKLSFAKNTNIQEAKLAAQQVGAQAQFPISFNMTIEMKSAAELNKLPKPSGKSTPRPTPSSTPSTLPTPREGGQ